MQENIKATRLPRKYVWAHVGQTNGGKWSWISECAIHLVDSSFGGATEHEIVTFLEHCFTVQLSRYRYYSLSEAQVYCSQVRVQWHFRGCFHGKHARVFVSFPRQFSSESLRGKILHKFNENDRKQASSRLKWLDHSTNHDRLKQSCNKMVRRLYHAIFILICIELYHRTI